ncbi:MAG: hypothetical protein ACFFDN_48395 [Candidatus Hodarchaeota archaeon]
MSIIDEFNRALELVERYEKYKLIRAWGLVLIIVGIARFLLGFIIWNLIFLIYKSLNTNINNIAFTISMLNSILQVILISSLAIIMIYTYVSIRNTSIKEGKIIFSRVFNSGVILAVLYFTTFVIRIPGSVYWEEVVGVFFIYFVLKRTIKSDIKELFHLGAILLVISIIEFIGRIFLVVFFLHKPMFIPLWVIFYLVIGLAFMIPYIVIGYRIFKKASYFLQERGW